MSAVGMYFINRSKLEEPCPFIVACYNLGDRKDHDLELALHTARCKQLNFSIWNPCYSELAAAALSTAAVPQLRFATALPHKCGAPQCHFA